MARLRKLHSLKRPKLRQDWNKYTLYNLSRRAPSTTNPRLSYFQQKWMAKSETRAYHNPYVREKKWTRMFSRRLPAVVPMDHRYLAKFDGSELASGRGMGITTQAPGSMEEQKDVAQKTPYMNMAFHPLERRLDTAIWRALFASSARQARQFVVHGAVKVNGKKMIHPSYQLNPGDMFSVEPERVLYATGARKLRKASPLSPQHERAAEEEEMEYKKREKQRRKEEREERKEGQAGDEFGDPELLQFAPDVLKDQAQNPRNAMKRLIQRAKTISDESKTAMSGKRQQELREFARTVKSTLSKYPAKKGEEAQSAFEAKKTKNAGPSTTVQQAFEALEKSLAEILVKIPADKLPKAEAERARNADGKTAQQKARDEVKQLQDALARARIARDEEAENPVDATKPYATPWRPREYMSAFAFIPRYLEVNHNICSAVYLRHPVARPGLAEVPTPFNEPTLQLAFNWYLRRR